MTCTTTPSGPMVKVAVERDSGTQVCVVATEPTRPRAGGGACATRDAFDSEGVFAVLLGEGSREVVGLSFAVDGQPVSRDLAPAG